MEGDGIFNDGAGVLVGFSVGDTTLNAAAGEEIGEGTGVVAPAIAVFFLDLRGTAEFRGEDDECGVQKSAFFEVIDESGVGGVEELAASLHAGEVVVMGVPFAKGHFDETNTILDEAAREKTALSEGVTAITVAEGRGFFGEVEGGEVFAFHNADGFVEKGAEVLSVGGRVFAMEALVDGVGEVETSLKILFVDGRVSGSSFKSFFRVGDDGGSEFCSQPSGTNHIGRAVDGDVARKGFIVSALEPSDPASEGGVDDSAELIVAFVKEVTRLVVISLLRLHRVNGANFAHDFGGLRKVARDLQSLGRSRDPFDGTLDILAWFEVEGVEMAHPAGHVEEDDVGGGAGFWSSAFLAEGLGGETSS